jgi:hypothetical protein
MRLHNKTIYKFSKKKEETTKNAMQKKQPKAGVRGSVNYEYINKSMKACKTVVLDKLG